MYLLIISMIPAIVVIIRWRRHRAREQQQYTTGGPVIVGPVTIAILKIVAMLAIPFAIISAIGNTYIALIIMAPFAIAATIGGIGGFFHGRIIRWRRRRARERERLEQIWQGGPPC